MKWLFLGETFDRPRMTYQNRRDDHLEKLWWIESGNPPKNALVIQIKEFFEFAQIPKMDKGGPPKKFSPKKTSRSIVRELLWPVVTLKLSVSTVFFIFLSLFSLKGGISKRTWTFGFFRRGMFFAMDFCRGFGLWGVRVNLAPWNRFFWCSSHFDAAGCLMCFGYLFRLASRIFGGKKIL